MPRSRRQQPAMNLQQQAECVSAVGACSRGRMRDVRGSALAFGQARAAVYGVGMAKRFRAYCEPR